MATKPISADEVIAGIFDFSKGVNTGWVPSLLPENQLANGVNLTIRGGFPVTRPPIRKCELDFGGDTVMATRFKKGRWQGATYYHPDQGPDVIITSIGGHLYRIAQGQNGCTVTDVSIQHATTTTADFVVPAVNADVSIQVASTTNIFPNTNVLIGGKNYFVISVDSGTQLTVQNVDDTPGDTVTSGAILTYFDLNPAGKEQAWLWQAEKWVIVQDGESVPIFFDGATSRRSLGLIGSEISSGRMGVYWLGRNWWVNPDGRTFRAGDIVYSASGTPAEKKRDAVLKQGHNTFLATGGDFTVPSNAGEITGMAVVNILDVSLGQGPLQVLTPNIIFGCTAPVDESQWQNVTNPLLSVSQIAYGGLSHYGTLIVNGDMIYRSIDGIRSLVIGRREVASSWGNTPISHEMTRYLSTDDPTLLKYSSATFFDNRIIFTLSPVYTQHGVYHRGLSVMNADPLSGVNYKTPPAYDGLWTSVNTLQLVKGMFGQVERAFAFSFQTASEEIELYELLPSSSLQFEDNNGNDMPIRWVIETPSMFRKTGIKEYARVRLTDGELYISSVKGRVDFRVLWRPDMAQNCWVPWRKFSVCAATSSCETTPEGCLIVNNILPQYRTRLGLGEPPLDCDPTTDKPFREFFTGDFRIEVQGHCRIDGAKFVAVRADEQQLAPVAGCD